MKKLILISAIVLNYITAYGQNNTGIGTTAPTAKLQVEGNQYLNAAVTGTAVKDALKINIGQDGFLYGNRTDNFGILMTTLTSVSAGNIARINFGDQSTGTAISTRYLSFSVGKTLKELMYITDANTSTSTPGVGINTATPTSTLQVNGSLSLPIKSISANYTLTDADYKLLVKTTSGQGDPLITLPDPTTCAGRIYVIQSFNQTAGTVVGSPGNGITLNYPVSLGRNDVVPANTELLNINLVKGGTAPNYTFLFGITITLQSDGTVWTGITQ